MNHSIPMRPDINRSSTVASTASSKKVSISLSPSQEYRVSQAKGTVSRQLTPMFKLGSPMQVDATTPFNSPAQPIGSLRANLLSPQRRCGGTLGDGLMQKLRDWQEPGTEQRVEGASRPLSPLRGNTPRPLPSPAMHDLNIRLAQAVNLGRDSEHLSALRLSLRSSDRFNLGPNPAGASSKGDADAPASYFGGM